jgi:hypothetical protein
VKGTLQRALASDDKRPGQTPSRGDLKPSQVMRGM